VADVAQIPGVAEQVKLVAGLRWQMLRNGIRRKSSRWDLIGMIWVSIFGGLMVIGVSVGFFAGTAAFYKNGRPGWVVLLFWAIFLWWQIFPIFEAGFGAQFEFRSLLRFPMSQRAFYLLGLGYGFADFGACAALFWIAAMLLATLTTRPELLGAMLGASALFVLVNVTLERLLGSWVERLMAKRRTREIFLALFVLSMVSLNFLNPLITSPLLQKYGKPRFTEWAGYFSWTPGSLAGSVVGGVAKADAHAAALGALGLLCWLVGLSVLLWQRFAAQYRGEQLSESAAPVAAARRERRKVSSGGLPSFLPSAVSGVMVKEFRYMTRNGFAFMSLVIPPVMVMFFMLQFGGKNSALKSHGLSADLFFPAMMAYLILILLSPAYNSFAYEGKGIQSYFMAPVSFRDVLLGKNLFLLSLVLFELALTIGLLIWRMGWPTAPRFFGTVMAAVFSVLGQLAIANWSSLTFPKKMELGKLKGQRNSGMAVWTAFGAQILLGGICAVILFAGQWTSNPWLPTIAFVGLTAAALAGYSASLRAMDGLAEQKKELLIETLCR
jgi:ABC-2 type transport system permease protein